jgi:hypothetical protein
MDKEAQEFRFSVFDVATDKVMMKNGDSVMEADRAHNG